MQDSDATLKLVAAAALSAIIQTHGASKEENVAAAAWYAVNLCNTLDGIEAVARDMADVASKLNRLRIGADATPLATLQRIVAESGQMRMRLATYDAPQPQTATGEMPEKPLAAPDTKVKKAAAKPA